MSLSPPFPPPQQPELLDPMASAGSLWRASRLAAFRDRAARSGLLPPPLSGDDGAGAVTTKSAAPETAADADDGKTAAAASEEVASLLARAAELSSELDALASRQAKGKVQVPWWADGEYDDAAADAANDRGVEALRRWKREEAEERRRKKKSSAGASSVPSPPPPPPPPHASSSSSLFFAEQALALFTEAVRLRPSSAVYCANRSRAALASGRAETAAAAAAEAARADPACPRAWSLHGRALSSLGRIREAVASFEKALKLEERGCGRAEGEAAAAAKCRLEAARASEAVANAAAASGNGGGARPALPRETAASEFERLQRDAGDAVEAAERALRAQPGRHELLRARAEVKRRKNVLDFVSTLIFLFLGLLKTILKLKKNSPKRPSSSPAGSPKPPRRPRSSSRAPTGLTFSRRWTGGAEMSRRPWRSSKTSFSAAKKKKKEKEKEKQSVGGSTLRPPTSAPSCGSGSSLAWRGEGEREGSSLQTLLWPRFPAASQPRGSRRGCWSSAGGGGASAGRSPPPLPRPTPSRRSGSSRGTGGRSASWARRRLPRPRPQRKAPGRIPRRRRTGRSWRSGGSTARSRGEPKGSRALPPPPPPPPPPPQQQQQRARAAKGEPPLLPAAATLLPPGPAETDRTLSRLPSEESTRPCGSCGSPAPRGGPPAAPPRPRPSGPRSCRGPPGATRTRGGAARAGGTGRSLSGPTGHTAS